MELGLGEIVLILLVALLVYGGRLPQVAAAVGRSVAELRRGLRNTTDLVKDELDDLADADPRQAVRRAWEARPAPEGGQDDAVPAELATEDISGETDAAGTSPTDG